MPSYAFPIDGRQPGRLGRQPSLENGLPIDPSFQLPDSAFDSPRDEDSSGRFGIALSPINSKGLSVLDAPLPASFDSNGISNAARFPAAPWPSSMPSKYGPESLSHSLNIANESRASEVLKLLHSSAFGSSEYLTPTPPAPSSSPPSQAGASDEYFGKRVLHSSRFVKHRIMSSSVPKTVDRDWEAEFAFLEEDYVPHNLRELLTPTEKARRGSVRAADTEYTADGLRFGGSPAAATSPNPWGPFYQRQKEEELEFSRSSKYPLFGHVGSPLRNSSLAHEMSNGDDDGVATTPTRPSLASRGKNDSLSVLTQQIQKTRIGEGNPSPGSPHLNPTPSSSRVPPIGPVGRSRDPTTDRHASSNSINSSAAYRLRRPIDEEDPGAVFSMEEDEQQQQQTAKQREQDGELVQTPRGVWSYASAVAGKESAADSSPTHDSSRQTVTG